MTPSAQRLTTGLLLASALALAGCGDDGSNTPPDASLGDAAASLDAPPPLDAGIADAGGPDADPITNITPGPPFTISVGNAAGQDEDPAVLRTSDGTIYVAWYSDRNGTAPDGRTDKELFLSRTTDGVVWSTPVQVTRSTEFSFYPTLAEDNTGAIHLVWWRVKLIPDGCTPGTDCTGTDNRILHKSSTDGVTWDLDGETEIASGPGDWLPSVVYDRVGDRLLVYFSAVVRNAAGNTDFSDTTIRIYVVSNSGSGWSAPARVAPINPDTSHNTYPHVVQRQDGTFLMTWTRYDASASSDVLQVIMEPSTETMYATSADGVTWTGERVLSGGTADNAIDVFPWLHADHSGSAHFVTWLSATTAGTTYEMPVTGTYPDDRTARAALAGYTARVVPTATPGVFFGAWVEGDSPTQQVVGRFFTKQ